jgi:hypothetical protein
MREQMRLNTCSLVEDMCVKTGDVTGTHGG